MWFWLICITLVLTICSSIICHRIAISQRGDLVFWGVLGFLIGPVAIPITWVLAGRSLSKAET